MKHIEESPTEGDTRRKKIIQILSESDRPVSGSSLAGMLGVSRQVIVQDIALLRAVGDNIVSTTKGYLLYMQDQKRETRVFMVSHTHGQIGEELNAIVDCGGRVKNVIVEHEIYGMITVDLIISNRRDVEDFVARVEEKKTTPLLELTNGVHYHTVEADSMAILDRVEQELQKRGFLLSPTE